MAELKDGQRIVDLGCGTGGVTRLILDRLRDAHESVVIAIDQSAFALKQAMENLRDARDASVHFVQSRVEQLSESVNKSADTIVFCNAIHYVNDKDSPDGGDRQDPQARREVSSSTPPSSTAARPPSRCPSTGSGCSGLCGSSAASTAYPRSSPRRWSRGSS